MTPTEETVLNQEFRAKALNCTMKVCRSLRLNFSPQKNDSKEDKQSWELPVVRLQYCSETSLLRVFRESCYCSELRTYLEQT